MMADETRKPAERNSSDFMWREIGRIEDDMDKKADDTEVQHVRELAGEAKKIALRASSREYACSFESDIKDLKKDVKGWGVIRTSLFISLFVIAMGVVAQFVTFREESKTVKEKVQTLTNSVEANRDIVLDIQFSRKAEKKADEIRQSAVVKSAIEEAFRAQEEKEAAEARARRRRAANRNR